MLIITAASTSTLVILSFITLCFIFFLHAHIYVNVSVDRIEAAEITVSDHTGKTH